MTGLILSLSLQHLQYCLLFYPYNFVNLLKNNNKSNLDLDVPADHRLKVKEGKNLYKYHDMPET